MADGLVDRALGGVAAGDVGNRQVLYQAGLYRSEDFESVAEHQHKVWCQRLQCVGHPDNTQAD